MVRGKCRAAAVLCVVRARECMRVVCVCVCVCLCVCVCMRVYVCGFGCLVCGCVGWPLCSDHTRWWWLFERREDCPIEGLPAILLLERASHAHSHVSLRLGDTVRVVSPELLLSSRITGVLSSYLPGGAVFIAAPPGGGTLVCLRHVDVALVARGPPPSVGGHSAPMATCRASHELRLLCGSRVRRRRPVEAPVWCACADCWVAIAELCVCAPF